MHSLLKMVRHGLVAKYWLLLGVAMGGGVLTKGPVILLHVLPVALLTPWCMKPEWLQIRWKQWYQSIGMAVVMGAGIALSWAIPAANAGGDAYRDAIFLGQTSGRIVDSFAHKLPWWWYFADIAAYVVALVAVEAVLEGCCDPKFPGFWASFLPIMDVTGIFGVYFN